MPYRPFVPDYAVRLLAAHPSRPPYVERSDGVVLFADIVGFSPLSVALANGGPYGAEELSNLLNGFFARMVGVITDHGGTVASFAGDAITALFSFHPQARTAVVQRAVRCALDMQEASLQFRAVATGAGTFTLAIRVGLGAGGVLMAVVGDPDTRLEHVLAGEAVNRAVAAERRAAQGQVLVDATIRAGDHGIELAGGPDGPAVAIRILERPRYVAPGPPRPADSAGESRLPAFLHPAIAERVRQGQVGLVDERRTVTVAFVGFPDLTDDLSKAIDRLQRFVAAAVRVIDRWGGHLRQVDVGDKGSLLVVAFGAPVHHEDQEERAVRCCMELLGLQDGPFRAGVTTGRAWCGEVGSEVRREYAIVGDTVNLAARLMEEAIPGQALIDRVTWEGTHGTAVASRLPPLVVRGRTGPVDVWSVFEVQDRTEPQDQPRTVSSLVGRRAELARTHAVVGHVAAGRAVVLGISGEPGIGKSRLAAEAINQARGLGFTTAAGTSRSLGPDSSYFAWRLIWRDLLGLDPWSSLDEQRDALAARFGQHAPLLAPVLNVPIPDSEMTGSLDPPTRAELLRSLLSEELRERARSAPIALLLEDCHWIDPPSRVLLEFLARGLVDWPVLFVVTARPTETGRQALEALAHLPHFTEITLGELPTADAVELARERVRQLYGPRGDPAEGTIGRIVERSGGNPFYLEELLSLVHARGRGQGGALDLPDSVERVVMARLDQLSEGEKAVMKVASVLGRRFRAEWISGCYPAAGSPRDVARHLRRLEDLRLTPLQAIAPEPEYGFRHEITQEVTYASLTLRMRTFLHERVAEYIEKTFPDRLAQFVDPLAYHYGRTARVDKQRFWFRAAADAAKAAFANDAAVTHYERLLPLLAGPAAGHVLIDLGGVWQLVGRWDEAQQAYLQALGIARAGGDHSLLAAGARELGDLFIYTQSYAEAIERLTLAVETFERLGDRQGLSRALDRLAYALIQQGSYPQASAVSQRHLDTATEAGDLAGMSVALDHLGLVRAYTGDNTQALALLQRSLQVATEAGDRRGVVHAANNLGGLYATRGDHVQALACVEQALTVAREIGYRQMAAVVTGNIGELYRERGDYEQATGCFAHALRIAVELGDWTSVANRMASLAATAAGLGDARGAEHRYTLAIRLARTLDAPHFLCEWLHGLAQLLASTGRPGEAQPLNEEALGIAVRHDERDTELRARLLRLRLRVVLDHVPSRDAAREALAMEQAWPGTPQRAALLDAVAQLDPARAETRAAAAELYRELYDRGPNVEYRQAYERLTGATLPPAPPLPPVPGAATPGPVDVDDLVRQVEPLVAARAPRPVEGTRSPTVDADTVDPA
jgi:class 3 adenylate cyclase/tetratricopeptide (TPR) repeat protein